MKKSKIIKSCLALLLIIGLSSIALLSNKKAKADIQDFDDNFYDYVFYFSPFNTVSPRAQAQDTTIYFKDNQNQEIVFSMDGTITPHTFTMKYELSDYFYIYIDFNYISSGTTYDIMLTYDTYVIVNPDDPLEDQLNASWCPFVDSYIPISTTTYENMGLIREIWDSIYEMSHYGFTASANFDDEDQQQYNLFWNVFIYTNTTLTYIIDQANDMYQNGYNTGYNNGKNYVLQNPNRFDLYNQEQYDLRFIEGQDDVISSPSNWSLYPASFVDREKAESYAEGLAAGSTATTEYSNVLAIAWQSATSFLNTRVLGNMTILQILLIPLTLGIFIIVIKIIRG